MVPDVGQWLTKFSANEAQRLRLVCFPHSGATGFVFREWGSTMPAGLEVWGAHLPGRAHRLMEPLFRDVGEAARVFAGVIAPLAEQPIALFGHSLGATIAYETALALPPALQANLRGLFVSGSAPPSVPRRRGPFHNLPDAELKQELLMFGGTPAEVLQNDELMALMLPGIRADFEMLETWTRVEPGTVPCPLFCYGGTSDPDTSPAELECWREYAGDVFRSRLYGGGHFFLFDNSRFSLELVRDIWSVLG